MDTANEFHSKIAGVSHKNLDGSDRQKYIKQYANVGDELLMVPEPYNPHSPAAIGLYVVRESGLLRKKKETYQLGYVSAELAPKIYEMLGSGQRIRVFISEITGGTKDKPTRGVNLLFRIS